jgi:hypothetical protein
LIHACLAFLDRSCDTSASSLVLWVLVNGAVEKYLSVVDYD